MSQQATKRRTTEKKDRHYLSLLRGDKIVDEKKPTYTGETDEKLQELINSDELISDTVAKKRKLEGLLREMDEDKDYYPSANKLFEKNNKFAEGLEKSKTVLGNYKKVFLGFTEAATHCDKIVSKTKSKNVQLDSVKSKKAALTDLINKRQEKLNKLSEKKASLEDLKTLFSNSEEEIDKFKESYKDSGGKDTNAVESKINSLAEKNSDFAKKEEAAGKFSNENDGNADKIKTKNAKDEAEKEKLAAQKEFDEQKKSNTDRDTLDPILDAWLEQRMEIESLKDQERKLSLEINLLEKETADDKNLDQLKTFAEEAEDLITLGGKDLPVKVESSSSNGKPKSTQTSKTVSPQASTQAKKESNNKSLVAYVIKEMVERGADENEISKVENINGEDKLVLNVAKILVLIAMQKRAISEVESKLQAEGDQLKGSSEDIKKIYDTLGEGRFRVFITVLPMIIGEKGLFPKPSDVVKALTGQSKKITEIKQYDNSESTTKFMGEILTQIGSGGKNNASNGLKSSTDDIAKVVGTINDNNIKDKYKKDLESATTIEEQQKIIDNAKFDKNRTLSDKDIQGLSTASYEAIEKLGTGISNVSEFSELLDQNELKKEDMETLSSMGVTARNGNGNISLKDDRSKRMKLAKGAKGLSGILRAASSGSQVVGTKLKSLSSEKASGITEFKKLSKPIKPIPPETFNEEEPIRGESESDDEFDKRMAEYKNRSEKATAEEAAYKKNMTQYEKDLMEYYKYVDGEDHYNQDQDTYNQNMALSNTLKKSGNIADITTHGINATADIIDIAGGASEISYQRSNMKKMENQTVSILTSLKIKDQTTDARKSAILKSLRGKIFTNALSTVAPSQKTKKKLAIPNALDEMQTNTGYKLLPAERNKLAIAAAAARACYGIKYKKDVSALNLSGSALSLVSNSVKLAGSISSLFGTNLITVGVQLAGACFGIASAIYNIYKTKAISKKQKERDKQIGKNVGSMMKALYTIKDEKGNLPTLAEMDNAIYENSKHKFQYSDETSLSTVIQIQNAVSAYDLLQGSGVNLDGMMVAAVKGNKADNSLPASPKKSDDDLSIFDSIDLSQDNKKPDDYKLDILRCLANL